MHLDARWKLGVAAALLLGWALAFEAIADGGVLQPRSLDSFCRVVVVLPAALAVGLGNPLGPGRRLAKVSLLAVLPLPWLHGPAAWASVVLAVVFLVVAWARTPRPKPASFIVDEVGVRRRDGGAPAATLRWEELRAVRLLTTSAGPAEDVFWVLQGEVTLVVPQGQSGALLDHLARLPRFDSMAVIAAMGSTDDAEFLIWEGDPGEAQVCRTPLAPPR